MPELNNMSAHEVEVEILQLSGLVEGTHNAKAEFTYQNLPDITIKNIAKKFNSTLHAPEESMLCKYYWTIVRHRGSVFKLLGVDNTFND